MSVPIPPAALYAATRGAGIFKSVDAGANWQSVGDLPYFATGIIVDPLDPTVVYAGTVGGMYRSGDQGWTEINNGIPVTNYRPSVDAFAASPQALYVGGRGPDGRTCFGVLKSTNRGGLWISASAGISGPLAGCVSSIAVDSRTPDTVYAAAGIPFRTTDAGLLSVDRHVPSRIYAADSERGLFRSLDGGASWSVILTRYRSRVVALAASQRQPKVVYAATSGSGIMSSTDGGQSWGFAFYSTTNADLNYVNAIAAEPDNGTVYAAVGRGVVRSTEQGRTWSDASAGLEQGAQSQQVRAIAVDPSDPATVYAIVQAFDDDEAVVAIVGSNDRGSHWRTLFVSSGGTLWGDPSLSVTGHSPATIYAYSGGAIRSSDGGASWRDASAEFGGHSLVSVAGSASQPQIAYALVGIYPTGRALYRSNDGGLSWRVVNELFDATATSLVVDPSAATKVYAVGFSGVAGSSDSGATWSPLNTGLAQSGERPLAIDALGARLYSGVGDLIFAIDVDNCPGDCNDDHSVTVDELLTMVNIALGSADIDACRPGDKDTSGTITVDEILTAVNNALSSCPTS